MKRFYNDDCGVTAIEFAMTAPLFMLLLFGIIQVSLALFTQLGIAHGAALAARCASLTPSTCSSTDTTQTYAVGESFGVDVPKSTFTVSTPACGNQVSASYVYTFMTLAFGTPSVTLTAQSCYPK
jgi:Flp pilus assembly protein TadG